MIEALSDIVISIIEKFGYLAIGFLMFLESSFFPVPSEVIMPFSGYVASTGQLNYWLVIAVGVIGQMLGASALYLFGGWEGRPLLEKYGKYILVRKKDIDHADHLFAKHGDAIVFFARFLPGIRMIISLPAGIAKMNYLKFISYSTLGIIPFTWGLTYLGVKMGENWTELKKYFHIIDFFVVASLALLVFIYIRGHLKKKNG